MPPSPSHLHVHPSPDPVIGRRQAARTVPALRERLVSRTALVNRLRTETAQIVTLVAPAGYGKTTLLTQWALRDPRTFAWLSLEAEDDDPKELRALLASVVAEATSGEDAPADLVDRTASVRTYARRLGRTLLAHRQPVVIVLDRVDQLRSKSTLAFVGELCDHLPPGVQVALAARALPAL